MSLILIGGKFRNRVIKSPGGKTTRPTTSLVRKAVFDICQGEIGNSHFLDLFAGSGAMGLEALSRGAERSVFIEKDRSAAKIIAENVQLLGVEDQVEIVCNDVITHLPILEKKQYRFNIIYIDPPYAKKEVGLAALNYIDKSSLLEEGGSVFIEGDDSLEVEQLNLKLVKKRVYGNTTLFHFVK